MKYHALVIVWIVVTSDPTTVSIACIGSVTVFRVLAKCNQHLRLVDQKKWFIVLSIYIFKIVMTRDKRKMNNAC